MPRTLARRGNPTWPTGAAKALGAPGPKPENIAAAGFTRLHHSGRLPLFTHPVRTLFVTRVPKTHHECNTTLSHRMTGARQLSLEGRSGLKSEGGIRPEPLRIGEEMFLPRVPARSDRRLGHAAAPLLHPCGHWHVLRTAPWTYPGRSPRVFSTALSLAWVCSTLSCSVRKWISGAGGAS